MIEPYRLFVIGTHSVVVYFDANMDLYKVDGTHVDDRMKKLVLVRPDLIRRIA